MTAPELGQRVRFVPAGFFGELPCAGKWAHREGREVTGRIVHINRPHRFFTVAFEINGVAARESFKF